MNKTKKWDNSVRNYNREYLNEYETQRKDNFKPKISFGCDTISAYMSNSEKGNQRLNQTSGKYQNNNYYVSKNTNSNRNNFNSEWNNDRMEQSYKSTVRNKRTDFYTIENTSHIEKSNQEMEINPKIYSNNSNNFQNIFPNPKKLNNFKNNSKNNFYSGNNYQNNSSYGTKIQYKNISNKSYEKLEKLEKSESFKKEEDFNNFNNYKSKSKEETQNPLNYNHLENTKLNFNSVQNNHSKFINFPEQIKIGNYPNFPSNNENNINKSRSYNNNYDNLNYPLNKNYNIPSVDPTKVNLEYHNNKINVINNRNTNVNNELNQSYNPNNFTNLNNIYQSPQNYPNYPNSLDNSNKSNLHENSIFKENEDLYDSNKSESTTDVINPIQSVNKSNFSNNKIFEESFLSVNIKIQNDIILTLNLKKGEEYFKKASEFCIKNNLNRNLVKPISDSIIKTFVRLDNLLINELSILELNTLNEVKEKFDEIKLKNKLLTSDEEKLDLSCITLLGADDQELDHPNNFLNFSF